jgi:hypothetical protein
VRRHHLPSCIHQESKPVSLFALLQSPFSCLAVERYARGGDQAGGMRLRGVTSNCARLATSNQRRRLRNRNSKAGSAAPLATCSSEKGRRSRSYYTILLLYAVSTTCPEQTQQENVKEPDFSNQNTRKGREKEAKQYQRQVMTRE